MATYPSQSYSSLLVQVKAALSEAACQACLSMTACLQGKATYPSLGYLSKSRLLSMVICSSQSYSSKSRPLVEQRLLVQVKAACQSNDYLSESRLLLVRLACQ